VVDADELADAGEVVDVDEPDEPEATRAERLAARAGVIWRALADTYSEWDAICAVGVLMLLGGLWAWFSAGTAFTVVGGLVLVLGVAGGRAAARAAAADPDIDEPAGGGRAGGEV
jgi:hypothetical protein